jgi:hypothetical protein
VLARLNQRVTPADLRALAADIAERRLPMREAIDRLIHAIDR